MKSRKTRILVVLWLVAISVFSVVDISFAQNAKDILPNPTNARQTIPVIHFRSDVGDRDKYVELKNLNDLVRIDTKEYNFVLKKGRSVASGSGSAILWWTDNSVLDSDYSTIVAWSRNEVINSDFGVVWWGTENAVNDNYWTVAGWERNTAGVYSTVVWGKNNTAAGDYSVVLWSGSTANGENSVAMWYEATVNGRNSFLWSDSSATLAKSHVFAVVGWSGMVVNTNTAHRFAKLTIGGSLLINEWTTGTVACKEWVLKVINRTDLTGSVCFCSCDGATWHSLFWAWTCSSVCGGTEKPNCGTVSKICDETTGKFVYSGTCNPWDVVEWPGAYMIDKYDIVHWTCETNDGSTKQCEKPLASVNSWICVEPAWEFECVWTILNGLSGNNCSGEWLTDHTNVKLYPTQEEANNHKCGWYCKPWFKNVDWDWCVPYEWCGPKNVSGYSVPYLAHEATTWVTKNVEWGTCTRRFKCDDSNIIALWVDSCSYSCQWTLPDHATLWSSIDPTSPTSYSYSENSTPAACKFRCDDNYTYNSSTNTCEASTQSNNCGTAPSNSTWVKSTFTQTWNGTAWIPTNKPNNTCVTTNTSTVDCSFKCNTNYECDGNTWCKPKTQSKTCGTAPSNSTWVVSTFKQTWNGTTWTPDTKAKTCVTSNSSTVECSFICDSTHKCNNDWDACIIIDTNQRCDNTTERACTEWWTAISTNDDETAWRWNCKDQSGCYKCKDEYTDKGNGVCERINVECGSAHGTNRSNMPTDNEACDGGSVNGNITPTDEWWYWTCKNGIYTSEVCQAWKNPACGTDNGKTVSSMPTWTAACNPWNRARPITGSSQFTWECWLGAKTEYCSANIWGWCGSADWTETFDKPTSGLCEGALTPSEVVEDTEDGDPKRPIWSWMCGSYECSARIPTATVRVIWCNAWMVQIKAYKWTDGMWDEIRNIEYGIDTYINYTCSEPFWEGGSETFYFYNTPWTDWIHQAIQWSCNYPLAFHPNSVAITRITPTWNIGYKLFIGEAYNCTAWSPLDCVGRSVGGYDVPNMNHGETQTVEKETPIDNWKYVCQNDVTCFNWEFLWQSDDCHIVCDDNYSLSNGKCEPNTQYADCKNLPTNAKWVNDQFKQTWNGTAWSPSSKSPTYTSSSSVECSYQCKTHYTWDGDSCEPDTQDGICGTAPSNSEWVLGTFKQTWNGNAWDPANKPENTCVTSRPSSVECSFICDSTHKCNNDWDACIIIDTNQRCDNTDKYKCTEWWTATSTNDDDSAWRWSCKDQSGCYKCKDGYTDQGNGVCVAPIRVKFEVINNGSSFWLNSIVFDEFPSCRRPQNTASDINVNLAQWDRYEGEYYTCDYFTENQNYSVDVMGRPSYYSSAETSYATKNFSLNDWDNTITITIGCTPKTCRDYDGYSSSSQWYCVNTRSLSDGCWWTLTCYKNWCQANWYGWYACIAWTQIPNACNDAWGKKDVQNMQDWYACVSCNGVTNSCEWPYVSNISECYHNGTQYDHVGPFNWCYLCICPSCALKTDSSEYASVVASTCSAWWHVVNNPLKLLPQNSETAPTYCAWCDDCSQQTCPDWYGTNIRSCPEWYTLQTNWYISTWTYGEQRHYCGKCVGTPKCWSADWEMLTEAPSTYSEQCVAWTAWTVQPISGGWKRRCTNPDNSSDYKECSAVKCGGTIVPYLEVQYYQDTLGYSCSCGAGALPTCCCDAP